MKKTAMALTLAACASCAFATDYTWNGGGDDNLWTNPKNWGKTASTDYPRTTSDKAIFAVNDLRRGRHLHLRLPQLLLAV